MHLYILHPADRPYDFLYAVGPEGQEPAVRAAARLPMQDMIARLSDLGMSVVQESTIVHNPQQVSWEGVYVRFPEDARHEYAGKTLLVTQATDGLPILVDPVHGDWLGADDMPLRWGEPDSPVRAGQMLVPDPGYEQVPLGPLMIVSGQFDRAGEQAFRAALEAAGYEVAQTAADGAETISTGSKMV